MGQNSPKTGPPKHSQLIFDTGAKAIQWRKDGLLTNGAITTGHPEAKRN